MASYLLLYSGGSMPQTEEEQAAVMKAWEVWFTQLGEAVADPGNPFTPQVKAIASNGTVTDGPIGVLATGYSIIKADSLDAATALAKSCPVLAGDGQISVYETFEVM